MLRDKLASLVTENKLERIKKVLQQRSRYVSFVFEHFYHEHNIHAAMRSIEGFGFQDVHIIDNEKKNHPSLTITKGADYWLTIQHYQEEQHCLEKLRAQGYTLVGTTPHIKAHTIDRLPLDKKIAVVFGNERIGLSDYTINTVDTFVTIPMCGFTESFNVSVSVALAAYELRQRLQESSFAWSLTPQEKIDLELTWLKRIVRGSEFMENL